jgi:hypothetical protein
MFPGKRNDPMGKMKSYIMEVDECVVQAIEAGARNLADIKAFCRTNMTIMNERHVTKAVTSLGLDPNEPKNYWGGAIDSKEFQDELAEHVLYHFLDKEI